MNSQLQKAKDLINQASKIIEELKEKEPKDSGRIRKTPSRSDYLWLCADELKRITMRMRNIKYKD